VPPWPAEALEEQAGDVAVAFASLLTRQAAWRHRRVETLTVLSHESVRRAVSVDFTVPTEHRDDLRLADGQWVVPLALLAKRALVHFDLRDEAGESVPLLRADETRTITRELLYLVLDLDLEDSEREHVDAGHIVEAVLAMQPPAPASLEEIDAAIAALEEVAGPLPGFAALAGQLARGFLLCAVVRDVGRRRILKFAYDEPLRRPSRLAHFYDAPGCTEAASYHAEVAVPFELRARRTELVDDATGEVLSGGPRDADRPALYFAGTRLPSSASSARRTGQLSTGVAAGISVRYGTERGRFLVPAALVAWLIALELALPWLFADLGRLAKEAGPAISILLSSLAVFSGLVLRAGEHPLLRVVLAPYRAWLAVATIALVASAGALGFHVRTDVLGWIWGIGALVAVLAAGILTLQAARAPSARRRPRPR
jgi:hypothetical protein